jgi:hypothetical protein
VADSAGRITVGVCEAVTLGFGLAVNVKAWVEDGVEEGVGLAVNHPNAIVDDSAGVSDGVAVSVNVAVGVHERVAVRVFEEVGEGSVADGVAVPVTDGMAIGLSV